jgi:predicted CXXCH cytochrome family protein
MSSRVRIAALAGVLCASLTAGLSAQTNVPTQPPTIRTPDCTTGGCHTAQTERKFLHGPNAVQACDACHEYTDPAKHTFNLKRPGRQLCDFCHIDKTGTEGPVVHKPVADGQCIGCHDPHGANNRRMLKKDTTPELCGQCHKEILSAKHVHSPAGEDCAKCHKPHTSDNAHLLIMEPRALCLSCHADVGKTIAGAKHPHDPAKGDCLQCHQPHASNEIKALRKSPNELCSSCHQAVADAAAKATHPHGAVTEGRACLNCHTPHGSDWTKQLKADPVAACLECHKQEIKVSKDRTVAGVPELANTAMHRHGPIEKGECAGCHTVHGGDRDRLLTGNYSNSFYQAFSDEAYELCFKCHNRQLALAQPADTQTKFRDGSRNLHAVHVNIEGGSAQGRSCRACHSIHASKNEQQINDNVPFGQWKLPINFIPNESGGSCSPGCHKPAKYNRGAVGSTAKPADSPASPVNPAVPAPAVPVPPAAVPADGPAKASSPAPAK